MSRTSGRATAFTDDGATASTWSIKRGTQGTGYQTRCGRSSTPRRPVLGRDSAETWRGRLCVRTTGDGEAICASHA